MKGEKEGKEDVHDPQLWKMKEQRISVILFFLTLPSLERFERKNPRSHHLNSPSLSSISGKKKTSSLTPFFLSRGSFVLSHDQLNCIVAQGRDLKLMHGRVGNEEPSISIALFRSSNGLGATSISSSASLWSLVWSESKEAATAETARGKVWQEECRLPCRAPSAKKWCANL